MATSANPAFQNLTPTTQVSLHSGLKVAQAAGMLAPPLYIVACLARKRPLSVNGVMRNAALSVIAGGAVGTGIGYARVMNQPEDKIVDRAQRLVSWVHERVVVEPPSRSSWAAMSFWMPSSDFVVRLGHRQASYEWNICGLELRI